MASGSTAKAKPKTATKWFTTKTKGLPVTQTVLRAEDVAEMPPQNNTQFGPVPKCMANTQVAKDTLPETYTEELRYTANIAGREDAGKLLRTVSRKLDKKLKDERPEEAPAPGSVVLEDFMIRKAFSVFDLEKRTAIGAAELRHLFAQLGEMPTDRELNAMIFMCDPRGEGAVSYEDFAAMFQNPADNLRGVNREELRAILSGDKKEGDDDYVDDDGSYYEESEEEETPTVSSSDFG
eukprot:TRINITY_DN45435_c0_g1_i1.p1 TRINITY_DN45435_c0_g1~~TRINITY_DN45435_c0_g1_i1.p1  ORF type:complete len:237 (+),score=61.55 TRINITY_DN45435_c0_g1_i1:95-805(+)